jgi:hypothetical protein
MAARGDRLESLVLTGLYLGLLGSIGVPISVVKTCGQLHGSGVRSHGVAVWGYVTPSVPTRPSGANSTIPEGGRMPDLTSNDAGAAHQSAMPDTLFRYTAASGLRGILNDAKIWATDLWFLTPLEVHHSGCRCGRCVV